MRSGLSLLAKENRPAVIGQGGFSFSAMGFSDLSTTGHGRQALDLVSAARPFFLSALASYNSRTHTGEELHTRQALIYSGCPVLISSAMLTGHQNYI